MRNLPIVLFAFLFALSACNENTNSTTIADSNSTSTTLEESSNKKPLDCINPFIGTGGHGHTFPGAIVPFGMIQLSPDTRLTGWDGCSAYHYTDNTVYGFSHTHLSGTGVSDYGDILLMPTIGEVRLHNGADDKPGYRSSFLKKNEIAKAGYYKTRLEDYKVDVELTATKRAGFHRYTFSEGTEKGNLIIDLQHRDEVLKAGFKVVNEAEVEGFRLSNAWAKEQHVYFVAQFSKPILKDSKTSTKNDLIHALQFDLKESKELLVRVGISAVSIDGARKNLQAEIDHWEFEQTKKAAQNAWTTAMQKIDIEGGTDDQRSVFYSALYHTMVAPNLFQDVDGKYRGMDLKIHESKSHENYTIFSLWDTYRATHPLYTIIEQKRTNDFIKTFLAQFDKGGILPIWELSANYTGCMIGYHSIPVIVDAYQKGIQDYDVEKAMKAMQTSAMANQLGLEPYRKNGFISSEDEAESVSKTLEYAYDDWCIAQMAKGMGKNEIYKKYLERGQAYKNIFDPSTGFMRAKLNKAWIPSFDPSEVNFHYTEANSWQYSFYVPQDIMGFIKLLGGKEKLDKKLDELFTTSSETTGREQVDITGLIGQYAHGNEPSHHMAYLYNYVNKPWKTQKYVRQIMDELYSNAPDGLSGNEDCGQMSAWYVLSAMGFYPVTPGDNTYVFGTPIFPKATIHLENGKTFSIKAKAVSATNIYIQSASLNGKAYPFTYLKHEDIIKGGELVFEMGSKPNETWGTKDAHIPSSSIDEHLILPVPFIAKGERAFTNETSVELGCVDKSAIIYYTLDGSTPNKSSTKYTEPIQLKKTTTIKFFAEKENIVPTNILSATFNLIPSGRSVKVNTKYANQYAAGGDKGLIDYIRGTQDFRMGAWQGYEAIDMDVVVDLGAVKPINKLSIGCLQDQNSWIFMPTEVAFLVSKDGSRFNPAGIVKNDISDKEDGGILKEFELKLKTEARYIKVVAHNRGKCPAWHKGAGGKSWIFIDEVIVE